MSSTVDWQGRGDIHLVADCEWLTLPDYWKLGECTAVAVGTDERVWVAACGDHPVSVWTPNGVLAGIWPTGDLRFPHGLTTTPENDVIIVDPLLHVARRYKPEGQLTLELGQPYRASACVTYDGRLGGPFNMPTSAAADSAGRIFVSDGYGNRQVHRFSQSGELEVSWGRPGNGPGDFAVVHGLCVAPNGEVIVADRENHRLQFFSPDGEFLREWTGLKLPASVVSQGGLTYVTEMGLARHTQPNGLSVFTDDGELVGRWYGPASGSMTGPHGVAVDQAGNVYVTDMAGARIVKFHRA